LAVLRFALAGLWCRFGEKNRRKRASRMIFCLYTIECRAGALYAVMFGERA
jgi:hypothetical protein